MSITEGSIVPRIGSWVEMPRGRHGFVEGIYNVPVISWLTNSLIYKVRQGDGRRQVSFHTFGQLTVLGHDGESVW